MSERCLTFECRGEALVGILHEPETVARDLAILIIVGGPQYRVGSHRQFVEMARALAAQGYPVMRFDYRGMGDSSGAPRGFESVDEDICAALAALGASAGPARGVVLFGLCDAASAALMYLGSDERVRGLILANPWARTDAVAAQVLVRHYYLRRLWQRDFWLKLLRGDIGPWPAVRELIGSLGRARRGAGGHDRVQGERHFLERMADGLDSFRGPVLFIMSGRDLTAREFDVVCRESPRWRELTARRNVSWARIPDSDHTFSSSPALRRATEAIIAWLPGPGAA